MKNPLFDAEGQVIPGPLNLLLKGRGNREGRTICAMSVDQGRPKSRAIQDYVTCDGHADNDDINEAIDASRDRIIGGR